MARFGVVTDGIIYRFYSDLERPNVMNTRPFLEVDLAEPEDGAITQLARFTKQSFDIDAILASATDLKYVREFKRLLAREFVEPSEDLVRILAGQVYSGRMTKNVIEQFQSITKRSFQEIIRERITDTFRQALTGDASSGSPEPDGGEDEIITTEIEIQGLYVVKAILADMVYLERIGLRDHKSYAAVLLDDNNRKPICRFHFDRKQLYIGLFDGDREEQREPITSISAIYSHSDAIRATAKRYES